MKAVWISATERVLKDYPIPDPAANEVLIKSACPRQRRGAHRLTALSADVAVASNPKDWKLPYCCIALRP